MGTFLVYIIKSAFCMTLLYLPYTLLLRRERLHRLNRLALLAILVVSFLLPAVREEWFGGAWMSWQSAVPDGAYASFLGQLGGTGMRLPELVVTPASSAPWWPVWLVGAYFFGGAVSLAVRLWQLARLLWFIPHGCLWKERREDGITLYCHARPVLPFSWMRGIVVSEADWEGAEARAVYLHEKAHVIYGHSWDTLLMLAAETLQWFNPVVWMYAREVRRNLEYLADDAVIRRGVGRKAYQLQLLEMTLTSAAANLYNHFNVLPLKTRIRMMNKKRTNGMGRVKYLLMIPAAALLAAACQNKESKGNEMEELTVVGYAGGDSAAQKDVVAVENPVGTSTEKAAGETPLGEVYDMVEQAPSFPGGPSELMAYLSKNIKYPKEAQAAKKEGRVIVQFVVASTGEVTNVKVMRGVDPLLDAEAIRVVEGMPRWTPGRQDGEAVNVRYTLPVTFRLS